MSTPRIIKMETVKKHNTPKDLWIVIEGKVYDVTAFRREHPGGEETLDSVAGQDGTRGFRDAVHSGDARQMMKEFYIGDLDPADLPKGKVSVRHLSIGIGAVLLGVAVVFLVRKAVK